MSHFSQVGLWIASGRADLARVVVLKSVENFGGNLTLAARDLGVSIRQMHRFIDRLGLRENLASIRGGISTP